jgi:protein-disulfide isomerase
MSRSRTVERRKQREQEQRRQRQITIAVVVAVIAVIGFVLFLLARQPATAEISAETVERYAGLPQSTTTEGYPLLGNPDAPVKVKEYSSFDCSHCREFYEEITPSLIERVKAGEVAFIYVPLYGTGGIQNGQSAARAALCAGEQGAFWTYHSALFNWQGQYGNQAFAGNRLTTGVDNLGLNRGEWDSCFGSDRPDKVLTTAATEAQSIPGFGGTPTITVNGTQATAEISAVNTAIDQALATSSQPIIPLVEATSEATAEGTTEATSESTQKATEEATVEATLEATSEATEESS